MERVVASHAPQPAVQLVTRVTYVERVAAGDCDLRRASRCW